MRRAREGMRARFALVALAGSLALSGCAHVAATRSGFLSDYTRLRRPTEEAGHLVYRQPELMPAGYRRIMFEPTVLRLGPGDGAKITAQEAEELLAYCDAALRKAATAGREVVAEPGEATLRVRAAITGLDTSNPALNAVTGVLFWPLDNGGVSVEIEALDSATAGQLVALVASSAGTPLQVIGSFSKLGHARSGIDRWTGLLGKLLSPGKDAAAAAQH